MHKRKDNKGRLLKAGESQRTDGKYEYKYTDNSGSRCSVYSWKLVSTDILPNGVRQCESLREKEEKILKELSNGITIQRGRNTLNAYIELVFETRTFAPSTYRNYMCYYKKHICMTSLGRMSVKEIKKSDVKQFYFKKKNEGYANGTIHILHKIIHQALSIAVDDNAIMSNPASRTTKEYVCKPVKEALTREEQNIFFEKIIPMSNNPDYYTNIYISLLELSCRINELLGLTWKDIDMKKRTVTINKGLLYRQNGKSSRFYISKNTSKNETRTIPMTDKMYEVLHQMHSNRLRNKCMETVDGYSDFVFVGRFSNLIYPNNLNRNLREIVKAYKDTTGNDFPHITNHIFRHTGCTNMVESGMDLHTVMYIMGHKKLDMIMKVYDTVRFDRVEREIKKLNCPTQEVDKIGVSNG
ncbi:MAG: integrase DNA-binding domain-containing protein [Suipraeoptans sp.]